MKLDRLCPLPLGDLGQAALLVLAGILVHLLPAQTLPAQTPTVQAIAGGAEPVLPCAPIERSLPPLGLEIPSERLTDWRSQIDSLEAESATLHSKLQSDVDVLLKACRLAVDFQELYVEKDFAKVDRLLELAKLRLADIAAGQAQWPLAAGRQVRGFRSRVDGSPQPVGLLLPEGWQQASRPLPLYVWLHGRGDKTTDLHFICERLDKDGQIAPADAIVVHPFGRQCIGYKSAGETDVMEAIEFVCANYPVDRRRIVLMGFSMGGAGVWHLAAHYGERFVAASPGAGFAETARYQNLQVEQFPVAYEQLLWRIYDVPGYTRNLFNLPVVAYSGEVDKQIQAARVMEEAFAAEGRTLPHLIGPGMGHKYHPDTLAEILKQMAAAAQLGQPEQPTELFIQSQHPRYAQRSWLTIDGPVKQYDDTRATAQLTSAGWAIETKNVARLVIDARGDTPHRGAPRTAVNVDGTLFAVNASGKMLLQRSGDQSWELTQKFPHIRKQPGLSGPIDDAFIDPFLVVLPTGNSPHAGVRQWVRCESENLAQRWQMLFRGRLRTKLDKDVTPQDIAQYHLLLWGDPHSNSLLRQVMEAQDDSSPLRWTKREINVGPQSYAAAEHILLAIRPNPLATGKYVVINSGPTFRQAHDRTNSLQNPHLPDWAVVSFRVAPSAESPGAVEAAGFFGDAWEYDPQMSWLLSRDSN